ncbi:MAG: divergent polysaccharide deacetylase family protein [Micavibrio sp.]|nr:divergent polysaccharide deacetylase family protein [Micavibrio sp.]
MAAKNQLFESVRIYRDVNDPRKPRAVHKSYQKPLVIKAALRPKQMVMKNRAEVVPPHKNGIKIAVVIDDMGMDKKRGYELIDLDVPLTLAFLPYAGGLQKMTRAASANGHELMIHMPMQPMNKTINIGTIGLKEGMSYSELDEQLAQAFDSFDGYVGLNNHMGSALTQNTKIMCHVLSRVKSKDIYFIDSKTISTSVAGKMARGMGMKTAERDVFLDHVESPEFVAKALVNAEQVARRRGSAIVIGHPKTVTIEGLKAWIPTLKAKGIEIVHASALVKQDEARASTLLQPISLDGGENSVADDFACDGVAKEDAQEAAVFMRDPVIPQLPVQLP